jgi:uncharacterized protein (DUF983 family)
MGTQGTAIELDKKQTILRGLKLRCPQCGEGKLFHGYISQHKACSACGEELGHIRADDAPPWATILITGHALVPSLVYFGEYPLFNVWVEIGISCLIAMIIAGLILPRAKGAFIAILWMMQRNDI